jgi:hypothetical protein
MNDSASTPGKTVLGDRVGERHAGRRAGHSDGSDAVGVSSTSTGITLDVATGSVDVALGTTGGTHTLTYRICERANPSTAMQPTSRSS